MYDTCPEYMRLFWFATFSICNGGEAGIRTLGGETPQRFSRPPLSTAQPPLQSLAKSTQAHPAMQIQKNRDSKNQYIYMILLSLLQQKPTEFPIHI